ncbi:MAG TPA: hypothetical protein VGR03_11730 [Candidatus Acidoferrum sp.]|nr:hypothetical protein [Candidatus Acidoferrum sp.]
MPCKHYKNALIEAAASGAQPQGELRAHLADCASCCATFAQEQALFSSIDAGLYVTANAELPASLLPRVRARLDEEGIPRRNWVTAGFVLASAAAIVIALFTARVVWRTNGEHQPVESVANKSVSAPGVQPPQGQFAIAPPVKKDSTSQLQVPLVRNPVPPRAFSTRNSMPEVLVPRDQEVLLVHYADQWRGRKRAPLVAADSDETTLTSLQVAPIQIAQLDVKLLAEEKPQ